MTCVKFHQRYPKHFERRNQNYSKSVKQMTASGNAPRDDKFHLIHVPNADFRQLTQTSPFLTAAVECTSCLVRLYHHFRVQPSETLERNFWVSGTPEKNTFRTLCTYFPLECFRKALVRFSRTVLMRFCRTVFMHFCRTMLGRFSRRVLLDNSSINNASISKRA